MGDSVATQGLARPSSRRQSVDTRADQSFASNFKTLCQANDVIEGMVHDILTTLNRTEIEKGLEDGILKCSHTTKYGGRIEINAIDLENLASPDAPASKSRKQVETKLNQLADSSFASMGQDTLESLFKVLDPMTDENEEFLAYHEIEDISFFTVISSKKTSR